jgi:DNA-binding GntR family transcriptional regulator
LPPTVRASPRRVLTEQQIAILKEMMAAIETVAKEGKLLEFYRLNSEFHMAIIDAAGNKRLAEIYTAVNKELNLFRWRALKDAGEIEDSVNAHRKIVANLEMREVEAFTAAVEEHLRAANNRLLQAGVA